MKDMSRATFLKLLAVVVVSTAVLSFLMLIPNWAGPQDSAEASTIDHLLDVTIVISSFVFCVVMTMMTYAIWKYRAKPGDESDGEPIHGNTRLEIIWTAIPTVIVLFAGIYSAIVLGDIEAKASGPTMRVNVYAQQFAWRFDYPDYNRTSTELHVPADTQLELHLEALDVLHSFWVPEWRIKRDLVPGANIDNDDNIDNIVRVTPTVPGTYSVICTELCGIGHSTMRATAVTEDNQADFDAWVKQQPQIPEGNTAVGAAGGNGAGSLADQ